jgi:Tol biopolymer transport system component
LFACRGDYLHVRRLFAWMLAASTIAPATGVAWGRTQLPALSYQAGTHLYTAQLDGSQRQELAAPSGAQLGGFSRDGSMLLVARGHEIDAVAVDGSSVRRLVTSAGRLSAPSFSPDGRRIVFLRRARFRGGYIPTFDVWVMGPNGSRPRRVARDATGPTSWSPDSRSLLVERIVRPPGRTLSTFLPGIELWRIAADDSSSRRLTSGSYDASAVWSPDGRHVAFVRTTVTMNRRIALGSGGIPSGLTETIFAIHADGSDLTALATQSLSPVYSPDGARIAFVSVRDHGGESCGSDDCSWNGKLYAMASDGHHQVALTHGQQDDERPSWTADGQAIVFLSDRANLPTSVLPNADLYTIAAGGGCPLRLTDASVGPSQFALSSSGATPHGLLAVRCPDRVSYAPNGVTPEFDTDISAAFDRWPFPVYYPGRQLGGLMLTDVGGGTNQPEPGADFPRRAYPSVTLIYDRCGLNPGHCGAQVDLSTEPVCADVGLHYRFGPQVGQLPDSVAMRHGALVLFYRGVNDNNDNNVQVYAGTGSTSIFAPANDIIKAVDLLGPFQHDQPVPRAGPLAAPQLPASLLRWIDRIERAHAQTSKLSALSRKLKISPARITTALRIARAIAPIHAIPSSC